MAVQPVVWRVALAALCGWLSVDMSYAEAAPRGTWFVAGEQQVFGQSLGHYQLERQAQPNMGGTRRTIRFGSSPRHPFSQCARSSNYSWVWRLQPFAEAPPVPEGELSEGEISSFGCLIGGIGLFAAGYLAGPSEAIMLWGGGLLTPSGSAVLGVSLLGGLGAAGCSFGATVAPTMAWIYEQFGARPPLVPTGSPDL